MVSKCTLNMHTQGTDGSKVSLTTECIGAWCLLPAGGGGQGHQGESTLSHTLTQNSSKHPRSEVLS